VSKVVYERLYIPILFGSAMALVDVATFGILKSIQLKWISPFYLIAPILLYSIQPYIFLKSLNYQGLATMNVLWDLISTVFVTIESKFLFNEIISNRKMLGIVLSLVSIYLLSS
jgi:multidrug transporter EmrE-like cation transporter